MTRGVAREGLTEDIYYYIVHYKKRFDGIAPSMREIANDFNTSTSVVRTHLGKLESQGKIKFLGGMRSRAIMVVGALWLPPK